MIPRLANVGAVDALPSSGSAPMTFMCLSISISERCFVKRSEGLRDPSIFSKLNIFVACASCSHKLWVRMCLSFPIHRRLMMPSAALASAYTDAPISIPMSLAHACTPRSSQEQATMPYVSASADDKAIVRCCRDQVLIVCDPNIITPPLVDFRLLEQPAQSESEKPSI